MTSSHPPLLGVGAALVESRGLYKRQQAALDEAFAEIALDGCITRDAVKAAIDTYLQHMRETEECA